CWGGRPDGRRSRRRVGEWTGRYGGGGVRKWWRRRELRRCRRAPRARPTSMPLSLGTRPGETDPRVRAGASARRWEAAHGSRGGDFLRRRNGDRARPNAGLRPLARQPELVAAALGARPFPDAEGHKAVETKRRLAFANGMPEPRLRTHFRIGPSRLV